MTNFKYSAGDVNWDILDTETWESIASYMNDDIREQVHFELAPCTATEFMERYLELDEEFAEIAYRMIDEECLRGHNDEERTSVSRKYFRAVGGEEQTCTR